MGCFVARLSKTATESCCNPRKGESLSRYFPELVAAMQRLRTRRCVLNGEIVILLWSTERSGQWQPLKPDLVVEVRYDHFAGKRFRRGSTLLRWRPDKDPNPCSMDQVEPSGSRAKDKAKPFE
jgi:ATP-dependent DNA ligase